MSYTTLLINTCSVYRYTTAGVDAYGKPVETWAAVPALTDIACRIMPVSGYSIDGVYLSHRSWCQITRSGC